MKNRESDSQDNPAIEEAASIWLARLDRGLTPEEQDRFTDWLAQDPAHREAMAQFQSDWENFDRLAGIHLKSHARVDPDLLAPSNLEKSQNRRLIQRITWMSSLPFAALLCVLLYQAAFKAEPPIRDSLQPSVELLSRIEQRTLEDGSIIEINRGSTLEVAYTDEYRRVFLSYGEAVFDVAKDADRPFVVNVAGVDVQAIGTVFSVKYSSSEVGVLVTEGQVSVSYESDSAAEGHDGLHSLLDVGQKAVVRLEPDNARVEVFDLNDVEISEATLWRPRLLDYNSITLGELVEEFNRSNPIQVSFGDPSLEQISLSSSFWSDNVEGFVRLMETGFGMKAEWIGSREIILRKASSGS